MNTTIKPALFTHPTRQSNLNANWQDLSRILHSWFHRARSRKALSRLDQHLLDDIGLNEREAQRETRKPFWQK